MSKVNKVKILGLTTIVFLCFSAIIPNRAPAYQQNVFELAHKKVYREAAGHSVAIAGNLMAFSAPGENKGRGVVYLCQTNALGLWELNSSLSIAGGKTNDFFGFSPAFGNGFLAVGAPGDDEAGTNAGAVYLFQVVNGGWQLLKKLTPDGGNDNANFGFSLAVSGDLLAIGAPGDQDNGNGSGAVYLFSRHSGGSNNWGLLDKLHGDVPAFSSAEFAPDYFGAAVAIDGEHLVIGAPGTDGNHGVDAGAAYLFHHQKNADTWERSALIQAADGGAWAFFGSSVAIDGNTVMVGNTTDNANTGGAAYVFYLNPDTNSWEQSQKLTANNGRKNDRFGTAIALRGNYAVISAPGGDGQASSSGTIYCFERSATRTGNWSEGRLAQARDEENFAYFGQAVAIDNRGGLVVGAPGKDGGHGGIYQENVAVTNFQFIITTIDSNTFFDLTVNTGIDPANPPAQTWFFFTWTNKKQGSGIYLLKSDFTAVMVDEVIDYATTQYDFITKGATIASFRLADLGLSSGDNLTYAYAYSHTDINQAIINSIVSIFVK